MSWQAFPLQYSSRCYKTFMMNTPLLTVNTYAHSDLKISMMKKWSTCQLRQILEQFKNVVIPGSCLNGRKKEVNMKIMAALFRSDVSISWCNIILVCWHDCTVSCVRAVFLYKPCSALYIILLWSYIYLSWRQQCYTTLNF